MASENLLKRVFDYQRIPHRAWVGVIVLLMPLLMALTYGLMVLTGNGIDSPQVPLLEIPLMFVLFFLAATAEELGWQAYAYPRLRTRWNALYTSILLGIVWALWHIIPYFQADNSVHWVVWQCIASVGLRVLIVWIFINTHHSLFAAIVFHAMINVSNFLFPNYGSHYDPFFASIIIWSAVALILYRWGLSLTRDKATTAI